MTDTMRALGIDRSKDVWEESRGLRRMIVPKPILDERADPLDAKRAIVRVLYSGVCGSDKSVWFRNAGDDMIFSSLDREGKDYRIAGHELLGRVEEAGSLVEREWGFRPGDIVTAESHITCGTCRQCRQGQREVCRDTLIMGFSVDGCFAEYVKLPAAVLWRSNPEKIRAEVGAIQEPFGNAVHACTKVDLHGKSLAVFGCGTIGMLTIITARALGASKIVGVEPFEDNARMAERLGADEVIRFDPGEGWESDPGVVEKVRRFGGDGVDVAMEMAGYNSSVNNTLRSVRMGGEAILFGIKSGDFTIESYSDLVVQGISLHGVIGRRIFETWNMSTRLLEAKENRIQEKIFDVILSGGRDTIVPIGAFEPADFEKRITAHPKVLIRWE